MQEVRLFLVALLVSTTYGNEVAENLARMIIHIGSENGYIHGEHPFQVESDKSDIPQNPKIDIPEIGDPNPEVDTTSGLVEGGTDEMAHYFYEIPYAEPPVGELRYQSPKPIQTRRDITARVNRGTQCHQFESLCIGPIPGCNTIRMEEDCLVLNVFSPVTVNLTDPSNPPSDKLPVFFYIHGGSFNAGAGTRSSLDGKELANVTNMVVVAINYRLGALGFLVHKEDEYEDIVGNQGLKDQQLALQWVQDNIEKFGGDKTRVTISGNSAGAQSVMFHTLSGVSEPLYARAIQQSNPAVFSYQNPEDSRMEITQYLLNSLRCNDSWTERECLMNTDPIIISNRVLSVMMRALLNGDTMGFIEPYRPVIDGTEFTDQPLHMYRDGKWNKRKNMIIGVQTQELDDVEYYLPEGLDYNQVLFTLVNYVILGVGATDTVVDKYATDYPPPEGKDWTYTFSREITHLYFICPSRAMARYASETAPETTRVYFYANEHPVLTSSCVNRNNGSEEGCGFATHAGEVRFVFRTVTSPDDNDLTVEDQFSTYWGSFVRTGSPSNNLESSLGDFEEWPLYTSEFLRPFGPVVPDRKRQYYAKLMELYVNHLAKETADLESREELPPDSWQNIRIKAPLSEVEGEYEEDICDFWDSVGYYMDPIPLPTTTTEKATKATTVQMPESSTTDEAKALNYSIVLLLSSIFLALCQ